MNRVVNFLQKYFAVISVLIGISILLSVTFSSYIVTSNNHKAAEMYIGELKYSIELNGSSTNTLTVPTGETIIDIKVNNLNPVDTYYKLLYLKNTNITVKYYESTKDTNDVVTTYNKPNDSITSSNSNIVKLLITNSSTSSQNIALTMKGGYITNTIQDIITPSTYSEITLVETPSTNTYFCTTTDTLTQGLQYVNGQYTYKYMQEGKYADSGLAWQNITSDGWGVQLTDKASTNAVTSKVSTYINNVPITSMSYMLAYSQATTLDVSNFDTSKVTNMSYMFSSSTNLKTIYVSNKFNTNNVTSSANMFTDSTELVGGAGTKYDSTKIDKAYAHIDGGTSNPGYFTDIADKDIPAPNSFAADSWKTIIKAVRNNNISKYNVGDTRTIDMGTYGTHTLRIANKSKPSSCSKSGYSQTACGFVLEFADIITTYNMNPAGTYKNVEYEYGWNKDGWPASAMRTFVNNDIYNSLPSDLRSEIVETTVVSGYGSSDSANFTSTDKLYLLSPMEVWGDWTGMYGSEVDRAKNQTRQLDYYSNLGVTYNNYNSAIKKHGKTQYFWWHRSAKYDNNIGFYGMRGNGYAYRDGGVSPAFRIG